MPEKHQSAEIERYRQLVKAMQKLTAVHNPDQILEYLVKTATSLGNAEMAWVLIPDRTNQVLSCESGFSKTVMDFRDISIPIKDSLEGWAYQNQQTITVNEAGSYDRSRGTFLRLPGNDIKSILIIPVEDRAKRHFILEVANKYEGEFSILDMEILGSLAQQAAVCYEKSQHLIQSDLIPELVHELRTPLAALNTALHLLLHPDLSDEKRERISQMAQIEFTRLTNLSTSFLDYARLKSGKEKFKYINFDLNKLIIETIDIIQIQFDSKDVKILRYIPGEPINIVADRDKIKQVLLNLLENAVKYTHSGGVITVIATRAPTSVSISIQDTGVGIPPELLPQLFERFYRIPNTERQIKGTGLGLTICKHIVEAHDGQIDVSSIVGQGSTFTIQIPVQPGLIRA